MKTEIHPKYQDITFTCACGATFVAGSTLSKDFNTEICSECHPFYTGKQKLVDSSGRVEKFRKKMENAQKKAAKDVKKIKKEDAEKVTKKTAEQKAEKDEENKEESKEETPKIQESLLEIAKEEPKAEEEEPKAEEEEPAETAEDTSEEKK